MLIHTFCLIETNLYLWRLRPREKIFAYAGTQLRKFKKQYNIVGITDCLRDDECLEHWRNATLVHLVAGIYHLFICLVFILVWYYS